uniref:Uncharacterized protein n=1 Tax=Romanomermis culicivorax TaxID=13658 RepID=A0A915HLY9_ROMCU
MSQYTIPPPLEQQVGPGTVVTSVEGLAEWGGMLAPLANVRLSTTNKQNDLHCENFMTNPSSSGNASKNGAGNAVVNSLIFNNIQTTSL